MSSSESSIQFGIVHKEEFMPALTMNETPRPTSTATDKKLEQQIRSRAYELYEAHGHDGHDVEDWLQAEIDIRRKATNGAAGVEGVASAYQHKEEYSGS